MSYGESPSQEEDLMALIISGKYRFKKVSKSRPYESTTQKSAASGGKHLSSTKLPPAGSASSNPSQTQKKAPQKSVPGFRRRKRAHYRPSKTSLSKGGSSNPFIKKADFLLEREELNEEDLETIVQEINKQEGEYRERNTSKL